jgi:hypothetical protein
MIATPSLVTRFAVGHRCAGRQHTANDSRIAAGVSEGDGDSMRRSEENARPNKHFT